MGESLEVPMKHGDCCAIVYFLGAFLCASNPDLLPARDWFNLALESTFGWLR
jgi:hypothetical protein